MSQLSSFQTNSDFSLKDLENYPGEHVSPPANSWEAPNTEKASEFNVRSCLCLMGATVALFCSIGFANAFGVFQEYYSKNILTHKSASDISWLGSFNAFLLFAGGIVVGPLSDKYGPRILLLVGSIITPLALLLTSFCTKYYQVFLAQGLFLGIGIVCIILPALLTIPRYFIAHRALALGITISGSSLGGVVWPIVLQKVLYRYGFGWGVRICGFIMLPLVAIVCLTVRLPQTTSAGAKPQIDFSAIKNPVLIMTIAGLMFIYLGLFSPIFFVTSWSISQGIATQMAFYMVAILNAASLFGRIIPGIIADRYGTFNTMIFSTLSSGIVCACLTKATSLPGIVLLAIAYGYASGGVVGLQGACAAQVVKPENYGIAMGALMGLISITALFGPPINGLILHKYEYLGMALFSGIAMLLGTVIILAARLKLDSRLLAKA